VGKVRQITYSQALSELEKIVGEIESEKIDLDLLAEKVKRASYLIKFCRTRLTSTEEEVRRALGELENKQGATEAAEEETDGY
jgi:exodeoxyribonuclease VII small subunit